MCFSPSTDSVLRVPMKTRLESSIQKFNPHVMYD